MNDCKKWIDLYICTYTIEACYIYIIDAIKCYNTIYFLNNIYTTTFVFIKFPSIFWPFISYIRAVCSSFTFIDGFIKLSKVNPDAEFHLRFSGNGL